MVKSKGQQLLLISITENNQNTSIVCRVKTNRSCAGQIVLPPSPPGQPRGQGKNVFDQKGRGTRKKGDFSD